MKMKLLFPSIVLALSGCSDPPSEALSKFVPPSEADVISMTGIYQDRSKDAPSFVSVDVPKSEWGEMLRLLSTGVKDPNSMKWVILGDVQISTKEATLLIDLYATGQKDGAFSVNQTYYRGGNDAEFIRLLSKGTPIGAHKVD